ncbi:filamentous hemagglutinin N-terminal domain-containing protein [Pannus brasiliensis CCIBt3594]|uniref:Filamentous hemagglutinin N-terminal domain-containing protein n=1 Tax=Pannus brasiliensis CCIBt3594 TaxID=1427578 RepID=A0AAW9QTZ2_9CHRO
MRLTVYRSVPGILLSLGITTGAAVAQVTIDGSVPTRVETSGDRTEVTGGVLAGTNLFHSFREFSIPTGQTVHFSNPATVTNIINRVTGTSASRIDGTIGANGTANVFLINPNGIIFGANARLNIGGSFLATTANSVRFADGSEFSAVDTSVPVLSVSVPVGLQFGASPQAIINRANDGAAVDPNGLPTGLRVLSGQSIALVGGDVRLEGGNLTAYGGRIAIGSVGDNSFVSLAPDALGWRLGYGGVSRFQDIQVSNAASIDASGPAGTIDLQGRRIAIGEGSAIILNTRGRNNNDELTDGSTASGDLTLNASDSISLTTPPADASFSAIAVQTDSVGNIGNVYLNTVRLTVRDGSVISAGTVGPGNAGQVVINASESVEIVGVGQNIPSLLTTSTLPSRASLLSGNTRSGGGGNITINTRRLSLRDGGQIQAATADITILDSKGNPIQGFGGTGGTIEIDATDSIEVSGTGRLLRSNGLNGAFREVEVSSSIVTSTGLEDFGLGGSNAAGNIRLNTARLQVANQGEILVNSFNSSGAAGNLRVNAGSISLDNQARLIADSSSGSGGNILLDATEFLSLRRGSSISANAGNDGDGGNIIIRSPFIFAVPSENSDITANAEQGTGGKVTISTAGIFGIQFRPEETNLSDITVSSEFAESGTFTLTRLDVDPQSELINTPAEVVDTDNLIVRACGPGGRLTGGEFTITGRGGLPADPARTLEIREGLADFGDRPERISRPPRPVAPTEPSEPIVEARGWIVSDGKIVLTDRSDRPTDPRPALTPADCHFEANRS